MNLLCIDIGSYSIKFLRGFFERKIFQIEDFKKVELLEYLDLPNLEELEDPEQYHEKLEERANQLLSVQFKLINEYIDDNDFDGKILLSLPESLITTRYLELPVNNRKKAEMMIPFQLEGNLPFSMGDTHWTNSLFKVNNGMQAQVFVTKLDEFDRFYSKLNYSGLSVATLAPPMSFWQSAIPELGMEGHAIIIDFGHDMVNAYHLINQRIVTNHTSYYAGKAMDEFIAHSFSLDIEQVNNLKLEKAVLLTEEEIEAGDADESQINMNLLMKQFLYPAMKEIKRWLISHQVKFNAPVEMIYLTGGMSNLPGFKEFIETNFHIPVRDIEYRNLPFILPNKIYTKEFGLCLAMAQSQFSKTPVANFLKDQYQSDFQVTIPLKSSSFLFSRAMILSLTICVFLLIEKFVLLDPQLKDLSRSSSKAVKNPIIALDKNQQKRVRRSPDKVARIINRKVQLAKRELESLEDASSYNAIDGILKLGKIIGENDKLEILEMTNVDEEISALIEGENEEEITRLKDYLSFVGLQNLQLRQDGNKMRIITSD